MSKVTDNIADIARIDAIESSVPIVNNTLTSTSTTEALSANMGKTLEDTKFAIAGGNLTGVVNTARVTVASHATTADIWAALGNQIYWTGTATTTAFPNAPQAGAERTLICAGACIFAAGANMLIDGVASGATVTCATGDTIIVRAISTTQFKLTRIKADGTAQVATPGGFTNMQVFNTSGTFNIASAKGAGVYYVECVGGGGGGGGGSSRWGQGGCGAGSVVGFATVSANVTVTIGAGGLGGAPSSDGNTGGNSSFGSFCTAGGGKGGESSNGTPSRDNYSSSSIGVNFIGKIKNGTSGSRGSYTDSGGSSVGGSSAIGGGGNATGDGTANSGGGGGGGNTTGTQGYAGGSGYVVVMW